MGIDKFYRKAVFKGDVFGRKDIKTYDVSDNTFYVSKNGDDTKGKGSFSYPFASIGKAVEAVIAKGDNADDLAYTIMVFPGKYAETIDLDSIALYNLSIMAMGGPHSVIIDPGSGNALECNANNDHLHYLYVKGIDFFAPINFLGADDDTEFLRYQGIFEDCLLSWGGTDDPHTEGKTMLTVINAGRFFWHGGSIHVLDSIVITNVRTSGIRGESYRGRFAGVGAPGTTTISNLAGNKPIGFDSDTMTYYIISAYVQRWEPSLVTTDGVVRYWLRNAYSGLAMGLTIPNNGHFYMHNSVQPGNVTLVTGCAVKLYKSHIRGTLTGACTDFTCYGSTKGTGLTEATIG